MTFVQDQHFLANHFTSLLTADAMEDQIWQVERLSKVRKLRSAEVGIRLETMGYCYQNSFCSVLKNILSFITPSSHLAHYAKRSKAIHYGTCSIIQS